jgi:hypothetical protein
MASGYVVEERYEESSVFKPHQHSQVKKNAQQKKFFPLPFLRNPPHPYPQVIIGCNGQEKQDNEPSSAFIIEEEVGQEQENIPPSDL